MSKSKCQREFEKHASHSLLSLSTDREGYYNDQLTIVAYLAWKASWQKSRKAALASQRKGVKSEAK